MKIPPTFSAMLWPIVALMLVATMDSVCRCMVDSLLINSRFQYEKKACRRSFPFSRNLFYSPCSLSSAKHATNQDINNTKLQISPSSSALLRSKVAVLEEAVLIMQNKLNNQRQQYRESEAKFKEEKNELLATVRQQTEELEKERRGHANQIAIMNEQVEEERARVSRLTARETVLTLALRRERARERGSPSETEHVLQELAEIKSLLQTQIQTQRQSQSSSIMETPILTPRPYSSPPEEAPLRLLPSFLGTIARRVLGLARPSPSELSRHS